SALEALSLMVRSIAFAIAMLAAAAHGKRTAAPAKEPAPEKVAPPEVEVSTLNAVVEKNKLDMKVCYQRALKRESTLRIKVVARRVAEIPAEIHEILRLFDGRRTIQQVLRVCGFAEKEARAVVEKLQREALIVELRPARGKGDDNTLSAWLAAAPRRHLPLRW